MQRIVKPSTKRGKRFLDNRDPKLIENDKAAIFIRGSNANNTVLQAMKDLAALKKPHAIFLNKKEELLPFQNITPLESSCQKKDCSLFGFGSHNKKRPNNLVLGRTFDHHVLDMFEFGVEEFKALKEFKVTKVAAGSKPILVFTEGFEDTPQNRRLKNFFIDFFKGPVVDYVNLKGLDHVLAFSIVGDKVLLRSYRVTHKKVEDKSVGVQLEEIGPRMNLVLRRSKLASDEHFKQSCKKPKQLKPKKIKNIKKDPFGTTKGRIHMERQDYSKLTTRRVKGLKKRKLGNDSPAATVPKKKVKPSD